MIDEKHCIGRLTDILTPPLIPPSHSGRSFSSLDLLHEIIGKIAPDVPFIAAYFHLKVYCLIGSNVGAFP